MLETAFLAKKFEVIGKGMTSHAAAMVHVASIPSRVLNVERPLRGAGLVRGFDPPGPVMPAARHGRARYGYHGRAGCQE